MLALLERLVLWAGVPTSPVLPVASACLFLTGVRLRPAILLCEGSRLRVLSSVTARALIKRATATPFASYASAASLSTRVSLV
jgi:hypothetical protein